MPDFPKSPNGSRRPAPKAPPRDTQPDNVLKFQRRAAAGAPGSKPTPKDWRQSIAGREGWVGLALIVLLAIALVAWRRMSGG